MVVAPRVSGSTAGTEGGGGSVEQEDDQAVGWHEERPERPDLVLGEWGPGPGDPLEDLPDPILGHLGPVALDHERWRGCSFAVRPRRPTLDPVPR